MNAILRNELLEKIHDYKAGIPVPFLELGHSSRFVPGQGNELPTVERVLLRQDAITAHVFTLLETLLSTWPAEGDLTFEEFRARCDMQADSKLEPEEQQAAESFVWKVFRCGWSAAFAGIDAQRFRRVAGEKK